jgi:hypothetical protein
MGKAVTILTYIRETPGSNLVRTPTILNEVLVVFPRRIQENAGMVPQIKALPSNSFFTVIITFDTI